MPRGTGTIDKEPTGAGFKWKPRKVKPKGKGPVRLIVDGKPCGCTFRYSVTKPGFRYRCEFHIAQRESIREQRRQANGNPQQLWPKVKKVKPKKKAKPDSPEQVAAFREEIARRTEILRVERAKIKRPTRKLTKAQREHLHTFAFTAEQVWQELTAK